MTTTTPPRRPRATTSTPGVFDPGAVGRVQGYPATAAAYEARARQLRANSTRARQAGRLTRQGVPNGYAGRRKEVVTLREEARRAAAAVTPAILRNSTPGSDETFSTAALGPVLAGERPAVTDDERAAVAMACLMACALDRTSATAERIDAMKAVLAYTKPMPRQEKRVGGLEEGLAWLLALA